MRDHEAIIRTYAVCVRARVVCSKWRVSLHQVHLELLVLDVLGLVGFPALVLDSNRLEEKGAFGEEFRKKAHSARNFSTSATLSCILDTVMMKMLLLLLLLLGAVRDDDDDDDEEEEEEEEIALGY